MAGLGCGKAGWQDGPGDRRLAGIGRAIAERMAADSAEVVLSYAANEGAAAEVAAAIGAAGGRAHAVQADLRDPMRPAGSTNRPRRWPARWTS